MEWEDTYDVINPFGDSRGGIFNSVWTFDLTNGILLLRKQDNIYFTPLKLAQERILTIDDFKHLNPSSHDMVAEQTLQGPYWEPELDLPPRETAFLGRVLHDFSHAWRHVLRRQMNAVTFMKFSYATIWILGLNFSIKERIGFEHVSNGGPYIQLVHLPSWKTPEEALVKLGSSWFVLTQSIQEGLEMIRRHEKYNYTNRSRQIGMIRYVILTLRQVVLCKIDKDGIVWTKPEALFHDGPASTVAIHMLPWAAHTHVSEPQPHRLTCLPAEIQDRILYYATASFVASAKLGCELHVGSPFSWLDSGVEIKIQAYTRHRYESSPVESHVILDGAMSGLSYKRESGY